MSVEETRAVPHADGNGKNIGNGNGNGHGPTDGNGHGPPDGNGHGPLTDAATTEGAAPIAVDVRAAASILAAPLQVAPGDVANSTISVTNLRREPCSFALSLSGLDPAWYGLPSRVGPLAPGERVEVPFHLSLPRGYPPCSLLLSVEARPLPGGDVVPGRIRRALPGRPDLPATPGNGTTSAGSGTRGPGTRGPGADEERRNPGRHDLQVAVGDGASISARLDPVDIIGGRQGKFTLLLRNRGSHSQQVKLQPVSPDQKLEVEFRPDAPLLLPGRELKVAGRVHARRRLKGEPQRRPFAVRVQGRGTPVMAEGSYTARPLLPPWAFKAVTIALVVVLWASAALLGIKVLTKHLHQSAVANSQLSHHHHAAHRSTGKSHTSGSGSKSTGAKSTGAKSTGAKSTGAKSTGAKSTGAKSTSSSPGSRSSSSGSTSKKTSKSTSKKSGSTPTPPKHSVEVTGKVTGSHPGGVTVTLSPTSLVSPQVLGASNGSTGTLASSVHRVHGHATHASPRGPPGVAYGPSPDAVLTARVRHGANGHAANGHARAPDRSADTLSARGQSLPMLVGASHRASPIPDGKVYGTEAAAAFFPSLVASITPTLTTTTLPDGSFVFTGVPAPGTYLVSFTESGYDTRKYVVQTSTGKNIALDTALSPGTGSLSGTVTGPKGPLGGVSITVSDGSVTITTVTPTTGSGIGTWSVSGLNTPDTYLVSASAPGYGTQITSAKLAASASLAGVDLEMKAGFGSISGTVTDGSSTQPVGDVTVTATNGSSTATATTSTVSPIGTYTLPNLAIPGTWTLTVSGQGWITQTQLVKLDGNTTVNASLTTSGANVVGVVKSGGSGLANVGISLSNTKTTYKTLSESVSPVGGFDFGQIPPGQYVLSATAYGYTTQSASVSLSAGQTQTVDLTLPYVGASSVKSGAITGSVVNQSTGTELTTIPIELDGKSTGDKTNGSGVYSITGVAPGLHEVTALGATKGFADAGVQVGVASGTTVTAPIISLPGLASLSGIVLSAATGLPIPTPTVELLNGTKALTTPTKYSSSVNGTYSITDIPAGNYVLKVGPKSGTTTYDTSETSVSFSPGEASIDNVNLTQGPTFQVKTYYQTTGGTLQPEPGVCVVVSRTTGGRRIKTAKLSTTNGGPVQFSGLVSGTPYVATFELPTTSVPNATACKTLSSFAKSAPTYPFVARPDNTAIYSAVLSPSHGGVSVRLQFPYVVAGSGSTGIGITRDCPVEAFTAPGSSCPKVLASTATPTLPTVSVTGITGYSQQTNGTPGNAKSTTVDLTPPSAGTSSTSDIWKYPVSSRVKFVSTQVTLLVSDPAGQFKTFKKTVTLPGTGTSQLDELLTPVPVPIHGTIAPATGVSIALTPSVLSPTTGSGVSNNLTSTDDIGAIEGTGGTVKWSDPATGASGGSAQPGTYKLTLSKSGYDTLVKSNVAVPLCAPKTASCGFKITGLTLQAQVTLVVTTSAVPGTSLALPTITLYHNTGARTSQVDQKAFTKTGSTYRASFTNELTPAAGGAYHFAVTGPAIQTYTSLSPTHTDGPLVLPGSGNTLTKPVTLVQDGWVKGTVKGVLVPGQSTEALSGATVSATTGTSCSTAASFTTTTTKGAFLLVGTTGGLVPGTAYKICVKATGFTPKTSSLTAVVGKNTATFTITATKLTQRIVVKGVGTGVPVTVTATSPLGPTLRCTFTVGSSTPKTCTTASAAKTPTTPKAARFTFHIDPTTYTFRLSAPLYEATALGPIPYQPGENPSAKTYTLTQQLVTIKGKVTVSATGSKSTHFIKTLTLKLTASTGKTYPKTTTSSSGAYTFATVPVGSYTITVGDTYTTLEPITFTTGTTSQFTENFSVYAPKVPVVVKVTNAVTGASANGVTVTLTPTTSSPTTSTRTCGTHKLLEKGLGTTEAATSVGSSTSATASFTSVVPDVYKVTFSGIGSGTDSPKPATHQLVVCPTRTSPAATTPSSASFALGIGVVSATVTLTTPPSTIPQATISDGTGTMKACTPVKSGTTATCAMSLLVVNTGTYNLVVSASGYTSKTLKTVHVAGVKTETITLGMPAVSNVTVQLKTTSHTAVKAAINTARVTLTGANAVSPVTTTAGGKATFPSVTPGNYKVVFTPSSSLSGASADEAEGSVKVSSSATSFTVKVKTGTVSGTVTLGKTTSSRVTVTVKVGSVKCGTGSVAANATSGSYSCILPPGTYTLTFIASGYTQATLSVVSVSDTATATKPVTLEPPKVTGVKVKLTAPSGVPTTAVKTASVTLTRAGTPHTQSTNSSGVATFSTSLTQGTYKVLVTPSLTGATKETLGSVTITSNNQTIPETIKSGTVSGTITLSAKATSQTTVTVKVGSVTCTTVTIPKTTTTKSYTCKLPPGTYTLTFTATGGVSKTTTKTGVLVTTGGSTSQTVTLP